MTEKNNFIFLDFDGVVNTENHQMKLASSNKRRNDEYGPLFDPDTVRRLDRIIKATSAKVCLISSWAYEGEERKNERPMERKRYAGSVVCDMLQYALWKT